MALTLVGFEVVLINFLLEGAHLTADDLAYLGDDLDLGTISTPASCLRRRRMMGPNSFQRRWTLQTSAVKFLKRPRGFLPFSLASASLVRLRSVTMKVAANRSRSADSSR